MSEKNFYQLISNFSIKSPDKPLLIIEEEVLSYREFIKQTSKIAASLSVLGVKKDSKVGLILSNSIAWYELFWGTIKIGAQPVPIDPQSGELELERLLNGADITICFIEKQYRNNNIYDVVQKVRKKTPQIVKFIYVGKEKEDISEPFITYDEFISISKGQEEVMCFEADENHVMSLACTSGSTGNPKILSVPYEGFFDAIVDMGNYLGFTEKDTMMVGMPLYHQGGFGMGLQVVVKGGSVIYQPQFDPIRFLETVEKNHVTAIQLTATLAKILISNPKFYEYNLSSIRICYFAGEVLPKEIAQIFVEKLGIRVINVIGSSETATMVVWDSEKDYEADPSDFSELPFTKVHILDQEKKESDIGELCIYTTGVIFNYYKNPQATSQTVITVDGKRCFMTGDMVERLPDGRYHFLGRCKRIIKRGANLVHAEEVEGYLLIHPLIESVAVIAKAHPVYGEKIVAYVKTVNRQELTRNDVARYFQGKFSAYKIPDEVIVTEELPHDIGKIQFKYIGK
ncbi:class I adenylate-forming enzyme family protein [[Clostridium] polysaccharolyticum]|uniref:Fatty-acyl-CoA synthase n=1 Tax=[Clostridium] polysaccharolyticum TaxID=29364 RepID=A0A1I0A8M9_9FIRM|nr:class I adenylate-forming enzyme family protein [[Clostridium] polysaccharolyticum]SES90552.1 fatty-acyl-CoA synthase [[Clostridium] polysaccharolyticum]